MPARAGRAHGDAVGDAQRVFRCCVRARAQRVFAGRHALGGIAVAVHVDLHEQALADIYCLVMNPEIMLHFKPPLPEMAGLWVKRADCSQTKSVGKFHCKKCKNRWSSWHSWREYKQTCRNCGHDSLPFAMWQNTGPRETNKEATAHDKPHDQARCEACRMMGGDCRVSVPKVRFTQSEWHQMQSVLHPKLRAAYAAAYLEEKAGR